MLIFIITNYIYYHKTILKKLEMYFTIESPGRSKKVSFKLLDLSRWQRWWRINRKELVIYKRHLHLVIIVK